MTRVDFLGYEVSEEGIRPGQIKTDAVEKFKAPGNVHEVRQFVGFASYFRKFIRDFAIIARPLTMLTKKDQDRLWGEEQTQAFSKIKAALISRPVLALYKRDADTELHTDASKWRLAGILLQKQSDEKLKPIAYFSRQTRRKSRNITLTSSRL